ncbi:MAG: murein biosynthesis integral membrane protein MurJ [Omnitrophica bacterium]|nr:murein biosynthesis integral membrane protein MurJ [Candidatus Omnitrophota bacterium]
MSNKRLIKSTGVISFATLVSRALGFVRDILIASLFGTGMFAEAFVVSFRIPNLFRDLVGEGAANAAFVPVLTEYRTTRSEREFWNLSKSLLGIMCGVLFLVALLGVLLAPVMVKAIAPGFIADPDKLEITISLTRIIFPFIFLVGLVAYGMGVLNSLNHFAAPAFGPALLNIGIILALIYVCPKFGVTGLAFGILAGGALQVIAIGSVLYKKGLRPNQSQSHLPGRTRFAHPAIKRIWKLLVPRFFGSAVYQMSVIVDNIFSTFQWIVGVGAPAALWYSYRLFHLPLAIFGIALATVALPKMSREVARKDIASLKDTINFSLRSVFLVLIPAGIGLATFGRPIIRTLFERGEFTAYSTSITNSALFFYSFGLFACGGIKILVNSFFSLGDTKTPVKVASVSFFINLGLNFALMWPLKIGGLALATSIAATFNFVVLYILLTRKIGDMGTSRILNSLWRVLVAGVVMGIFSYAAGRFLDGLGKGFAIDVIGVIGIVLSSLAIYVLVSLALGVGEMKRFLKWILRRG